jgi:hypothetical protein
LSDVLYRISHQTEFVQQAVFLDDANTPAELLTRAGGGEIARKSGGD